MKNTIKSVIRTAFHDQRGQVLPLVALGTVAMLGMGGMSIDVGRAYVTHAQLQNYANAAVLAAAGLVYNTSSTTNATTEATLFSASSGDLNANQNLGTVTTNVWTTCLNALQPSGAICPKTNPPPNAVKVTQTATIPTYFMKLFHVPSLTVAAMATASMQGQVQPWNVAIILDATHSMATSDTNCGSVSEFQCALNGIQALLGTTNPCKSGATTCANADANFHVALFAFPPVSADAVTLSTSAENNCSNYQYPMFTIYTLPDPAATSYTPIQYQENLGTAKNPNNVNFTSTYEVTYGASDADANGFVSDYYDVTQSNGLSTSSSIVKAITKCMQPNSGNTSSGTGGFQSVSQGGTTYYSAVLYAAQSALTAEAKLNKGTNNAIIFLSDGQANMVSAGGDFVQSPFTAVPSTAGLNTLTGTGLYPDGKDDCQQAIIAAQQAAKAGTTIYSVAYGSEQQGCTNGGYLVTDTTTLASSNYPRTLNATFSIPGLSPCVTMENIASSLANFYSDYNQSGSGSTCQDASHTVTSLTDIFMAIEATFSQPRLVPNNAS